MQPPLALRMNGKLVAKVQMHAGEVRAIRITRKSQRLSFLVNEPNMLQGRGCMGGGPSQCYAHSLRWPLARPSKTTLVGNIVFCFFAHREESLYCASASGTGW